jgi:hypothetical protein
VKQHYIDNPEARKKLSESQQKRFENPERAAAEKKKY